MSRKDRIIHLIEFYLNHFKKNDVEGMYGNNSKIKILDLNYSTQKKSLFIESKIFLGDIICEEILDREVADILIQQAIVYFYPNIPVKVSINWES